MKNKVYILGGAQTDFERNWTKEGKTFIAMLKEAVEDGFKDAGFTMDEMVRLNKENRVCAFVGNFIAEQYISQGHLGAFLTEVNPAFYGVPSGRYEAACASSSVALDAAITKILAEEYDVCIVVGWEVMKSGIIHLQSMIGSGTSRISWKTSRKTKLLEKLMGTMVLPKFLPQILQMQQRAPMPKRPASPTGWRPGSRRSKRSQKSWSRA